MGEKLIEWAKWNNICEKHLWILGLVPHLCSVWEYKVGAYPIVAPHDTILEWVENNCRGQTFT